MMILYGTPRTRATRVSWMLEEIGAQYEYRPIQLDKGEGRQAPYLALNPTGKVPTLIDDDLVLTESAAILTYLGDKYTVSDLVPRPGGKARAQYDQLCYFCLSELEQPLWTMAKHSFVLPESKRVAAVKESAKWEFAKAYKELIKLLDGRHYALGNQFSAADILLAHTLNWAKLRDLELNDAGLNNYAQRVLSRPALARAREREQNSLA